MSSKRTRVKKIVREEQRELPNLEDFASRGVDLDLNFTSISRNAIAEFGECLQEHNKWITNVKEHAKQDCEDIGGSKAAPKSPKRKNAFDKNNDTIETIDNLGISLANKHNSRQPLNLDRDDEAEENITPSKRNSRSRRVVPPPTTTPMMTDQDIQEENHSIGSINERQPKKRDKSETPVRSNRSTRSKRVTVRVIIKDRTSSTSSISSSPIKHKNRSKRVPRNLNSQGKSRENKRRAETRRKLEEKGNAAVILTEEQLGEKADRARKEKALKVKAKQLEEEKKKEQSRQGRTKKNVHPRNVSEVSDTSEDDERMDRERVELDRQRKMEEEELRKKKMKDEEKRVARMKEEEKKREEGRKRKEEEKARKEREESDRNYGIDDLSSGDETDDDEKPKKKVPQWASHPYLTQTLEKMHTNPPFDCDKFFGDIMEPDLDVIFNQSKKYPPRTSSVNWNSPITDPTKGESRFYGQ